MDGRGWLPIILAELMVMNGSSDNGNTTLIPTCASISINTLFNTVDKDDEKDGSFVVNDDDVILSLVAAKDVKLLMTPDAISVMEELCPAPLPLPSVSDKSNRMTRSNGFHPIHHNQNHVTYQTKRLWTD
jgi:hypothetical protein